MPPDSTENVNLMVNREKYEAIMALEILENTNEQNNLVLRLQQSNVVKIAGQLCNRKVLCIQDYDGNSGKTELDQCLMMEIGYQLFTPDRTRDL